VVEKGEEFCYSKFSERDGLFEKIKVISTEQFEGSNDKKSLRTLSRRKKMRIRVFMIALIFFGLGLSLSSSPSLWAQEEENVVYIPKQVKEILDEGMTSKQPLQDISIDLFKHIYLPARDSVHSVFFFKVKNSDLGFAPMAPAGEEQKKEESEETEEPSPQAEQGKLRSKSHLFLLFKQLDNDTEREVYVPIELQMDGTSYNPEEEAVCTTGYPLMPGNYMLGLAIASWDLKVIGTQYMEFSLPNPADFKDKMDTTPIFFVNKLERMPQPEMKVEIHRDYFTYSVLQITPSLNNLFKLGQNLDIFFFIYGTQPKADGNYEIEATYQVMKDDEPVIKFAGTKYNNPIVSQPLPLKKTVVVQKQEGEQTTETKEVRDLEAGQYTLQIDLKCLVSGNTTTKAIDFTIEAE
jgi:hypothetical protein